MLWFCAVQISSLSALLAGFALVAISQMQISINVNGYLLIAFGSVTAAAVGCALSAMLSSTLVLVAVSVHVHIYITTTWLAHTAQQSSCLLHTTTSSANDAQTDSLSVLPAALTSCTYTCCCTCRS
jgi:Mediator of CRAC channel activity